MFKKRKLQEAEFERKVTDVLDRAEEKHNKEAKRAQRVILANGFTLALLVTMGGKGH